MFSTWVIFQSQYGDLRHTPTEKNKLLQTILRCLETKTITEYKPHCIWSCSHSSISLTKQSFVRLQSNLSLLTGKSSYLTTKCSCYILPLPTNLSLNTYIKFCCQGVYFEATYCHVSKWSSVCQIQDIWHTCEFPGGRQGVTLWRTFYANV